MSLKMMFLSLVFLLLSVTVSKTPVYAAQELVACTMDAKICPDGSYVSRQGPECRFAACPTGERIVLPEPEDKMQDLLSFQEAQEKALETVPGEILKGQKDENGAQISYVFVIRAVQDGFVKTVIVDARTGHVQGTE